MRVILILLNQQVYYHGGEDTDYSVVNRPNEDLDTIDYQDDSYIPDDLGFGWK